jgi:hypothetical protein
VIILAELFRADEKETEERFARSCGFSAVSVTTLEVEVLTELFAATFAGAGATQPVRANNEMTKTEAALDFDN